MPAASVNLRLHVPRVKRSSVKRCCNVKMSSLNGDLHVELEGAASAGAVEDAVWRAGGPGALAHGNRGRPSPRRLPVAVRDAVAQLMTTVYVGFNDTHLTEKLRKQHAVNSGAGP
jgi:hypothetical protein